MTALIKASRELADFCVGRRPVGRADAHVWPGLSAHEVRRIKPTRARHRHELQTLERHDLDDRRHVQIQAIADDVDDAGLDALGRDQPHQLPLIVHANDERTPAGVVERADEHCQVGRAGQLALEVQRLTFPLLEQANKCRFVHEIHQVRVIKRRNHLKAQQSEVPIERKDLQQPDSPHDGHVDGIGESELLVGKAPDVLSCLEFILGERTDDMDRTAVDVVQEVQGLPMAQMSLVKKPPVGFGDGQRGDEKGISQLEQIGPAMNSRLMVLVF